MDNETSASVSVVTAWQDALNQQDSARLLELSAPDIEVVGPRGSAVGRQVLREWLGRAGLTLATQRTFAHADLVVLEQRAVWHDLDTGNSTGDKTVASAFRVNTQHQVARYARYDDLREAFAATGLGPSNESK